jgi:alkanesulfonate monooxygenase SsuD/methylene tetrahydromethanopterin reductase-like flavin-dependent oxidoreductase (luciferase family)
MKISCWLPNHVKGPHHVALEPKEKAKELIRYAKLAEDLGFEGIWAEDHLLELSGGPYRGLAWLDTVVSLAYLAGHTETLGVGTIYQGILRPPVVAAKEIASLMYLAPDRFRLGITIGYGGGEHEAAGVPKSERGRRTDEWMAAFSVLMTEENASFDGKWWQFENVTIDPHPGKLPTMWVAAGGTYDAESRMDESTMTPRIADRVLRSEGWIISSTSSVKKASGDWERIAIRAREIGRDPNTLYISHGNHLHVVETSDREKAYEVQRPLYRDFRGDFDLMSEKIILTGSIDDILEKLRQRAELGVQEALLFPFDGHGEEQLKLWAKHILPVISGFPDGRTGRIDDAHQPGQPVTAG